MNKAMLRLSWGLAVSLGLNLFLLGFLIARWGFEREVPTGQMFRVGEVLDRSKSPPRAMLKKRREELKPHRRAVREARGEARRALEAEVFEANRLAQALETLRKQSGELKHTMHDALVELAEGMTPEERRRLAETNWRGRRRRKP